MRIKKPRETREGNSFDYIPTHIHFHSYSCNHSVTMEEALLLIFLLLFIVQAEKASSYVLLHLLNMEFQLNISLVQKYNFYVINISMSYSLVNTHHNKFA